jgi:hypothetical protein
MRRIVTTLLVLACAGCAGAADSDELLPPVPVLAGGRPLDVEREGHSAPFVADIDGDGKLALLVGQFYEGRLRIYRNTGTRDQPKFDTFTLFEAGGKVATVPEG